MDHRNDGNDISFLDVAVNDAIRRRDDLAKTASGKLGHLSAAERKQFQSSHGRLDATDNLVGGALGTAGDEPTDLIDVIDGRASPDYFRHDSKIRRTSE